MAARWLTTILTTTRITTMRTNTMTMMTMATNLTSQLPTTRALTTMVTTLRILIMLHSPKAASIGIALMAVKESLLMMVRPTSSNKTGSDLITMRVMATLRTTDIILLTEKRCVPWSSTLITSTK